MSSLGFWRVWTILLVPIAVTAAAERAGVARIPVIRDPDLSFCPFDEVQSCAALTGEATRNVSYVGALQVLYKRHFYLVGKAFYDDLGRIRVSPYLRETQPPELGVINQRQRASVREPPLGHACADGYVAQYTGLRLGSLFPVLGRVYLFDRVLERDGDLFLGGTECKSPLEQYNLSDYVTYWQNRRKDFEFPGGPGPDPDAKIPDLELDPNTYVFPRIDPESLPGSHSAGLHGWTICVRETYWSDSMMTRPVAEVAVVEHDPMTGLPPGVHLDWRTIGTGESLELGENRHRVTQIVPRGANERIVNDRPGRLIGWIALDPKPVGEDK